MEIQKESIFVSALRSFCKTVAVIIAIFIAFIPFTFLFSMMGGGSDRIAKTSVHILPDAEGNQNILSESYPAILQIKIHGVIGAKDLTNETIENILVDSRKGILKNNRIKGILLNINSPGGAVFDSDSIYRMIDDYKRRFKIPVYAYVDGLLASGSMYIACAADQIYSSPVGVIGSVGVLMGPFFNLKEALNKWGVKSKTLTIGNNKAAFSPFKEWSPDEGEEYQNIIAYIYERFLDIVTNARPKISKQDLVEVYGARVFDAKKAQEIGFIDFSDSDRQEALQALVSAAGITSQYQVVELKPKSSFVEDLFGAQSALLQNLFQQISYKDQFSYLYKPTFSSQQ